MRWLVGLTSNIFSSQNAPVPELSGSRRDLLSGDDRAGWSARLSVRERHRQLLKENWRFLSSFAVMALSMFVVASVFATGPLQRGFILGSGTAIVASMIVGLVVLGAGTAPLMMGELAEQWTAQELRPLITHGWRLVNHFGLGYGDQDHVLVGPGGVILVETKWGAGEWTLDERDQFFRSALNQTLRNAKQLEEWAGLTKFGRPHVEPVLVLWGRARRGLKDQAVRRHSGVLVLAGDQLQGWALKRGRDKLTAQQVEAIWAEIERHVTKRDAHERTSRPMPRSFVELLWAAVGWAVAGPIGFITAAQTLPLVDSLRLWVVAGVVLLAATELLRRRVGWMWPLRAFQIGLVATYGLAAAAVLRTYWF